MNKKYLCNLSTAIMLRIVNVNRHIKRLTSLITLTLSLTFYSVYANAAFVQISPINDVLLNAGDNFQYTPTVSHQNGTTVSFKIANKPSWLSFNTATGELSGVAPSDKLTTATNIIITITNNFGDSVSSNPFSVAIKGDLQVWLKTSENVYSDNGTQAASQGDEVMVWQDATPYQFDAKENSLHNGSASDKQPTFISNSYNFHPAIDSDGEPGNAYSMGLHLGSNYVLSNSGNMTMFTIATPIDSGFSIRHPLIDAGKQPLRGYGIWLNNEGIRTHMINSPLQVALPISDQKSTLTTVEHTSNDTLSISVDSVMVGSQPSIVTEITSPTVRTGSTYNTVFNRAMPFSIGRQTVDGWFIAEKRAFKGRYQEVLVFNEAVSDTKKQAINSYLGLKYGLTLSSQMNQFTSGDGDVLWDDANYWHHIVGLGKDNETSLDQRISRSQEVGASLTVSTDTDFFQENSSHLDSIDNNQFIVFGSNDLSSTQVQTDGIAIAQYPIRIDRVWKIKNTNFSADLHLKFDNLPNSVPGYASTQPFALLWDADGDFTSGSVNLGQSTTGQYDITAPADGYITIAIVNTEPTSSDLTISMAEDTTHVFSLANFPFEDVDLLSRLHNIKFLGITSGAQLKLNGINVANNDIINVSELPTLTYAPTEHLSDTSTVVSFFVGDGTAIEHWQTTPHKLTINITPVDDAPIIDGLALTTIGEDSLYVFIPDVIEYDVGDTNIFSIINKPTWATFDTTSGKLSGSPTNSDVATTSDIEITVTDSSGLTDKLAAFDITVFNTNDAPTISGTPPTSVNEGNTYSFTPTFDDVDVVDVLTLSLTGAPNWLSIDPTTGKLSGTPTNDDVGISNNITISVSDAEVTTSLAAFNLTVINVNQAPTISSTNISLDENAVLGSAVGTPLTASDIDANTALTFRFVSGNEALAFTIDNDGQITVADAAKIDFEQFTSFSLIVEVSDGLLTDIATVIVNINDITELASFSIESVISTSVIEDQVFLSPAATLNGNPIGDVSYAISGIDAALFTVDSLTGQLSLSAKDFEAPVDAGSNNIYDVLLTVTDADNNTAMKSVAITVRNFNLAPSIDNTALVNQNPAEDFGTITLPFTIADLDHDNLTLSLINSDVTLLDASVTPLTSQSFAQYDGTPFQLVIDSKTDTFGSVNLQLFTTDIYGLNDVQNIEVAIDAVLDFPTIDNTEIKLNEDFSDYRVVLQDFDFANQGSVVVSLAFADNSIISTAGDFTVLSTESEAVILLKSDLNATGTTAATITITAPDNSSISKTINITVMPINDAPTINNIPAHGTEAVAYSWFPVSNDVDNDNSSLTFSAVNLPSWATIDVATGEISGTPSIYDAGNTSGIKVSISDGQLVTTYTYNIAIGNVNQIPVYDDITIELDENTNAVSVILTHAAIDLDDEPLTYTITAGNTDNIFAIDNNGIISVISSGALDYETLAVYTLTVNVADADGANDSAQIIINLTNINEAPIISNLPQITVAEGNTYSYTPGVVDPDIGDVQQFTITGQPSWTDFDTTTGTLSGVPSNDDVGTSETIVISVQDRASLSDAISGFTITVTNVNQAPVISGAPAITVLEDAIYRFEPQASDPDTGDSITFNITNKPTWATFNPLTGELSGTPINSDVGQTNAIIISVTDNANITTSLAAFNLTVINVNQAPTISSTNISLDENAVLGSAVGTPLTASDIDANTTLTFRFVSGNEALAFTIDNDGQISVKKPELIDYEATPSFPLLVEVSDGELIASTIVTIIIGDIVESSNFSITSVISTFVEENVLFNSPPVSFSGTPIGTVAYSLSGSDAALFTVDYFTGQLTLIAQDFETPKDADLNNVYEITLTAIDSDGNSASKPIAINVRNQNIAPSFTSTAFDKQLLNEGFSTFTLPFSVGDADQDKLTLSLINSSPLLVDVSLPPSTELTFSQYDDVSFDVTLASLPHQFGSANIQLIVTDLYGLTAVNDIQVTIPATLDFPTIDEDLITLNEDFADFNIKLKNIDFSGQDSISVSVVFGTPDIVAPVVEFTVPSSESEANITLTALLNSHGSTTATITVTATEQSPVTKVIDINVVPVNDAPTLSGQPTKGLENQAYYWTPAFDDIDTDNQRLSFTAHNLPHWASIDVITGEISGMPGLVDAGVSTGIIISVSDGSLTTSHTVSLAIGNDNQLPEYEDLRLTLNENSVHGTIVATHTAQDIDNDPLSYQIISGNSDNAFSIDAQGVLKVNNVSALDFEQREMFTLVVEATDPSELSDTAVIVIDIVDINESPVMSGTPSTSVLQDATYRFTPITSDPDTIDSQLFFIENMPLWASFDIATGTLSGVPTNSDVGISANIVISVQDKDGLSSALPNFAIEVININEPPILYGASYHIDENSAKGAKVGGLAQASDPDALSSFTYAIVDGDDEGTFTIDNAGQLSVKDPNRLDFEKNSTFELTISVSDGELTDSATIIVTVDDIIEISSFSIQDLLSSSINENIEFTSPRARIEGSPIGVVIYSLSGDDRGIFSIDSLTGQVTLAPQDYEAPTDSDVDNVYHIVVNAIDADNNMATKALDVTVLNQNVAPVIISSALADLTQREDFDSLELPFTMDDADKDSVTLSLVNSESGIIDVQLSESAELTFSQYSNRDFYINVDSVANQFGSAAIQVIATDQYGLSDSREFEVSIPAIFDYPTLSEQSLTLSEDFSDYAITLTSLDFAGHDSLTIDVSFADDTLIAPVASFVVNSGQDQAVFNLQSVANRFGITSATVTLSAEGQQLEAKVLPITVNAVNDAPTIDGVPVTGAEISAYSWSPTANDIDSQHLTFFANNLPNWLSINTDTGVISGTPSLNDSGRFEDIEIFVNDGQLTSSHTVTIVVSNLNQSPVYDDRAFSIEENSANGFIVSTHGAIDPDSDPLTYVITSGNSQQAFAINQQGQITVNNTTALDYESIEQYLLTIVASDGQLNVNATIIISLTDVLDGEALALSIINKKAKDKDTVTIVQDDYKKAGITGVDDGNVNDVNKILGEIDPQELPLTKEKLQDIVDTTTSLKIINKYSTTKGSADKPTLQDFDNIGIDIIDDELLEQFLAILTANPLERTIEQLKTLFQDLLKKDSDNDGLSDATEIKIGSNVNDVHSPTIDGHLDDDNDGVTNTVEVYLDDLGAKQYPDSTLWTDSDNDGLPDVLEINLLNGDPLDPNKPTNNGDFISENTLSQAMNAYLTSLGLVDASGQVLRYADFDNDGYSDSLEVALSGNPLRRDDNDVDLDGVANYIEAFLTPVIDDGEDSKLLDFNRNGLSDSYEARQASTVKELQEILSITGMSDHDGDGIADAVELYLTGNESTDNITAQSDSDNDGITDLDELKVGTNPLKNDIPVLWIESHSIDANQLQLDTYFGGLASSKITYAWDLSSLTTVGMSVSAVNVKQPIVVDLVNGIYPIEVMVTRTINQQLLTSIANYLVKIDTKVDSTVLDDDNDGVANIVDNDNGNTGKEEFIPTKIEENDLFKMRTDNGVKLRLGAIAILRAHNGSEVTDQDIALYGDGYGGQVAALQLTDDDYKHDDIFDYEMVNLPYAGATVPVFIPLSNAISEQATLRKFNSTDGWVDFDTTTGDQYYSAPFISTGLCSYVKTDYVEGLVAGNSCLLILITDGGPNDADGQVNGMIQDPVAVSSPQAQEPDVYKTSTRGAGSLSMLWAIMLLSCLMLRSKRTKALLATLLMVTSVGVVQAETTSENQQKIGGYVSASVGQSWLSPMKGEIELDRQTAAAMQLSAGWLVDKYLTLEVYYTTLGDYNVGDTQSIKYSAYGLQVNKHYPLSAQVSIYASVGLSRLATSSKQLDVQQANSTSLHIGLGLEYDWDDSWFSRVELKSIDRDAHALTLGIARRF